MNKPLNRFATPWQDCLGHEAGLKSLLERAKRQEALTDAVKRALDSLGFPSLSQALMVQWRPDRPHELTLVVPHSATGARLLQILPSIAKQIQWEESPIKTIHVRVKPNSLPPRPNQEKEPPVFSSVAQRAWENLYEQLPSQSSLRETIQRLLKNRGVKR